MKNERELQINYLKMHDCRLPRCTDAETYKVWRELRPPASPKAGFCEDCTPQYQRDMAALGKCDHPEVLFYKDDDGLIYGSFYPSDTKIALNANQR